MNALPDDQQICCACLSLRIGTILIGLLYLLFDLAMASIYSSTMLNSVVIQKLVFFFNLTYNIVQLDLLPNFHKGEQGYLDMGEGALAKMTSGKT